VLVRRSGGCYTRYSPKSVCEECGNICEIWWRFREEIILQTIYNFLRYNTALAMINSEEGGNTPLRHVGYYLRADVALYARRIRSSLTPI
jgi:hypothetical protein